MPIKTQRRNLGRGLSALIPDADMAFLSQIARGDSSAPQVAISGKKREKLAEKPKSDAPTGTLESKLLSDIQNALKHDAPIYPLHQIAVGADSGNTTVEFVPINMIEANPYQ